MSNAGKLRAYKPLKMKLGKIKKMKTDIKQFFGAKTTSQANAEGRLKIANPKRKALKSAVKKASTKKKASKIVPGLI